VTSLLMAGAAGAAICSDLGARKIREEIDAMEVLGLDPIQRLVAPRLLACTVVAILLNGVVAITAILTGFTFNVAVQGGTPGSYISAFASFAQPADLLLAEFKAMIFGILAAVVACHKGLTAKGGPKGVADGVNEQVVLTFVLLFAVNIAISQIYIIVVPQRIA
jgi:phospholipid/cholesterol/gamma-HCH transport system permease protein